MSLSLSFILLFGLVKFTPFSFRGGVEDELSLSSGDHHTLSNRSGGILYDIIWLSSDGTA